jgi:hypothetical protein
MEPAIMTQEEIDRNFIRGGMRVNVVPTSDDPDMWLWEVLDEQNGVVCDGYEGSRRDAEAKVKHAKEEEVARRMGKGN